MRTKVDFTLEKLNALYKLLGQIKRELNLTAEELDFFSLSPYVKENSMVVAGLVMTAISAAIIFAINKKRYKFVYE